MIDGQRRAPTNVHGHTTRTHERPQGPITTNNKGAPPELTNSHDRPQLRSMNGHGCPSRRTATGAYHHDRQTATGAPDHIDERPIAPSTIPQPAPPPLSSLQPPPRIPYISRRNGKTLVTPTQHDPTPASTSQQYRGEGMQFGQGSAGIAKF